MKLSSREDIEAPIDRVFDSLCEFESFERAAMRRGADVMRVDALTYPGVGMTWDARFPFRGKRREMRVVTTRFEPPQEMIVQAESPGMHATFAVELIALSRSRTRMIVGLEMLPRTLSARLLVQSLKLAKTSLTKRFRLRFAEYAQGMEERLKRSS